MPFTPTSLRKSGFPRQNFSHEQLLQICRYYQNLLAHLRTIQAQINDAIDTYQHSQSGRPSAPLQAFIVAVANIDAGVRGPLLDEIIQVEMAAMKWEGKSSKLRSEAKRQQRLRAKRKGFSLDEFDDEFAYTERGTDPFAGDTTAPPTSGPSDFPPAEVISPTMALARKGMEQLPLDLHAEAPDTSGYKKSGLV